MMLLLMENLGIILFILILGICFISFILNKDVINSKSRQICTGINISSKEYETYKKIGENVLINTTISFSEDDLKDKRNKSNLYYGTVIVGNKIIQSEKISEEI